MSTDVQDIISTYAIVIINETHFNIRTKFLKEFIFISSSKPRGGVAVLGKVKSDVNVEILWRF